MFGSIDLDRIDISQNPPKNEPERQYYYIAKCRKIIEEKSREKGRKMPSKRTRKKGRRPRAIAKWNIIKILTILLKSFAPICA